MQHAIYIYRPTAAHITVYRFAACVRKRCCGYAAVWHGGTATSLARLCATHTPLVETHSCACAHCHGRRRAAESATRDARTLRSPGMDGADAYAHMCTCMCIDARRVARDGCRSGYGPGCRPGYRPGCRSGYTPVRSRRMDGVRCKMPPV